MVKTSILSIRHLTNNAWGVLENFYKSVKIHLQRLTDTRRFGMMKLYLMFWQNDSFAAVVYKIVETEKR